MWYSKHMTMKSAMFDVVVLLLRCFVSAGLKLGLAGKEACDRLAPESAIDVGVAAGALLCRNLASFASIAAILASVLVVHIPQQVKMPCQYLRYSISIGGT